MNVMCVIARALGEDVDVDAIRRQILEEYERAKQVNPHRPCNTLLVKLHMKYSNIIQFWI